MPRVSIITPTYNHAGYIRECIDSVIAGTYQDWEMLIVDDGSTDGTGDVVRAYDDPRIRLFRKENGGIMKLSEGYNLALKEAKGDLIAILEGDDYWPVDKLALQVPEFDDEKVVLVSGFAQIVDDEKNDLGKTPKDDYPTDALLNQPVGTATRRMLLPWGLMFTFPVATMLRKSALERIGGFRQPSDLPLVDYPTFLAISLEGEFRFVRKTCGYWRRHPQSITTSRLPDILNGCYRESMTLAKEQRARLGLTDAELDEFEWHWEQFQALRLTLMGRMLSEEGKRRDASRAFAMSNRFRRSRKSGLLAGAAAKISALGLPVEWLYGLAHGKGEGGSWREAAIVEGDAIVRASDVDRPWPVYRHAA